MDREFVLRILRLTPLRPYLRWEPLLDATKSCLVDACFDRAVLLPEIHGVVLQTHLQISHDEMPVVARIACSIQYDLAGEVGTPGKYLPRVSHRGSQRATMHG